jgi:hypothetical protein
MMIDLTLCRLYLYLFQVLMLDPDGIASLFEDCARMEIGIVTNTYKHFETSKTLFDLVRKTLIVETGHLSSYKNFYH